MSKIICELVALGASGELIAAVAKLEAKAEQQEHRREQNRIYKQNQRSRQQMSDDIRRQPPPPSLKEKVSPAPPLKENHPSPSPSSLRSESCGSAFASRPIIDLFEEFWREYPKRDGSNPKKPAERKFVAHIRSGVEAQAIIEGAKKYRRQLEGKSQVGTVFVAQAQTWLNQQRWIDEAQAQLPLLSVVKAGPSKFDLELLEEFYTNYPERRPTNGKG